MHPQGGAFASDLLSRSQSGHPSKLRIAILVGSALGIAFLAWFFWGGAGADRTFALGEESEGEAAVSGQDSTGAEDDESDYLWVHVSGAVCEPGVYRMKVGSRVNDALMEAGGFTDDASLDSVNLARVLNDGEHIVFPTEAELETGAASGAYGVYDVGGQEGAATGAPAFSDGLVNINTAGPSELETLPGVGPATASKIIADREANGPFVSTEDIKRVSGIGDAKYAQMASLICI